MQRYSRYNYYTVGERAGYLSRRYTEKYARLLELPDWTPDELAELGYAMKQVVTSGLVSKRELHSRIAHCVFVSDVSPSIQDVWDGVFETNEPD